MNKLLVDCLNLREGGGCSSGARSTGAVPNAPNIGVLVMPERIFVAVQVASSISKARFSDVAMRTHRRNRMQEVELLGDQFIGIQVLEGRLVAFDLDERMLVGGLNVVGGCHLHQLL